MPWKHHVVRGTLMREKYVKAETKEMRRNGGLSERFYVATQINGWNKEVKVALLAESDATRIFEEAKAKDGKYPEEGIPVDAQIIQYTRLRERDAARNGGWCLPELYYTATSLNEDILTSPHSPSW